MALPSTPSAANWNSEFSLLSILLDACISANDTTVPEFCVPFRFQQIGSGSSERERVLYFSPKQDMFISGISLGVYGGANTATVTISPSVSPDLLAQGVTADYPSHSVTAASSARADSSLNLRDSTTNKPYIALKRGAEYKIEVSCSGATAVDVSGSIGLTTKGKRF